ncbi:hypothetical protein ACFX58_04185 [Sphingomonas sp. NCPPB 2930]
MAMGTLAKNQIAGAGYTAAYAGMIAANSVFIGYLVRGVSPALLAFGSLLMATVIFRCLRRYWSGVDTQRTGRLRAPGVLPDLLKLNAYTAITWLGLFYAVQYLRPSVNAMIVNSVGPLLMAVMWRRLRPGSPTLKPEKTAAAGILLSMFILVGTSFVRSGQQSLAGGLVCLGVFIALVCGALQTSIVLSNKRLLEAGLHVTDVLSNRFLMTILIAGVLAWLDPHTTVAQVRSNLGYIAILAVTFVVLPAVTLQLGLQRAEPVTVMIILFCIPLLTAAMELLDPAHAFDRIMFTGVCVGIAAAMYGALARRSIRAETPA